MRILYLFIMSPKRQEPSKSKPRALDNLPRSSREVDSYSHAKNKRLYSNRESRLTEIESIKSPYCDKRQRSSSWLLVASTSCDRPKNSCSSEDISLATKRHKTQPRPSKFLEGSMNDRVSKRPPLPYLETNGSWLYDEKIENFHQNRVDIIDHSDIRNSSIIRIRRSIAATFNLCNWKIRSKDQELTRVKENGHNHLTAERLEKAEKAYSEYKKSGQLRDSDKGALFRRKMDTKLSHPSPSVRHDSGVEITENSSVLSPQSTRTSEIVPLKRRSMMSLASSIDPHNDPLSTITYPKTLENSSSSIHLPGLVTDSDASATAKSLSQAKSQSLVNLRKALISTSSPPVTMSESVPNHKYRKTPTRKELHKQKKLVKRVSNLELKLNLARRQLAEAISEPDAQSPCRPIPHRKRPNDTRPSQRRYSEMLKEDFEAEMDDQLRRDSSHPSSPMALKGKFWIKPETPKMKAQRRSISPSPPPSYVRRTPLLDPMAIPPCRETASIDGVNIGSNVTSPNLTVVSSHFSESEDEQSKKVSKDILPKLSCTTKETKDDSISSSKKINVNNISKDGTTKPNALSSTQAVARKYRLSKRASHEAIYEVKKCKRSVRHSSSVQTLKVSSPTRIHNSPLTSSHEQPKFSSCPSPVIPTRPNDQNKANKAPINIFSKNRSPREGSRRDEKRDENTKCIGMRSEKLKEHKESDDSEFQEEKIDEVSPLPPVIRCRSRSSVKRRARKRNHEASPKKSPHLSSRVKNQDDNIVQLESGL